MLGFGLGTISLADSPGYSFVPQVVTVRMMNIIRQNNSIANCFVGLSL